MNFFRRINKYFFILTFFTFIFLVFFKPPLPKEPQVLDEIKNTTEPAQVEIPRNQKGKQIITKVENYEYRLTPLFSYELKGVIVSEYASENWLDVRHKDDPGNIKDICVVWGDNIKNGSYRIVKFSSGEFTCFWRWDKELEKPFIVQQGSNNHLIPQNEAIGQAIRKSKIGDQILVKGMLANYEVYKDGQKISERETSTVRNDGGNGACEIIFVTDFEILRQNDLNFRDFKKPAGLASLASGILGLIFILFF